MSKASLAQRLERFIARREMIAPHSQVIWTDAHSGAACLRLDELRELLALIPPTETPTQEVA